MALGFVLHRAGSSIQRSVDPTLVYRGAIGRHIDVQHGTANGEHLHELASVETASQGALQTDGQTCRGDGLRGIAIEDVDH